MANEEEGVHHEDGNDPNNSRSVYPNKDSATDEEGEEEGEAEDEDEEYADDDGFTLRFHGGMDPLKFAEVDASGVEPYKQFERLKCEVLAERKRKNFSSFHGETGKKPRQEFFFGAGTDEINEIMGVVATKRRSKQPKKRGRKKGSMSNMSPQVMEKLGEANLHYAFGQFDEAATLLAMWKTREKETCNSLWVVRCGLLSNAAQAISVLKEVVLLAPNLPDSYQTLGLVYTAIGEKKKALNFYLIAAHLTPKDPFLWKRLVHWSMELGYVEQVIYCLTKAIAADTEDIGLRFDRASLYIEKGDYQKAAESFDQILRLRPADVEICKACASMYHKIGQCEKAIDILERFIEDHCISADFHLVNLLVTLQMEKKEYGKALEQIERAKTMYGFQQLPLFLSVKAGVCHAHLDNLSKAEMYFNDLRTQPIDNCASSLCEIADAMMSLGHHETALKYLLSLDEATEQGKGNLYLKLAKCYLNLKQNEKALSFLYKAISVMEDNVDARIALASLLCEENKEDEAISFLTLPKSLSSCADQQPTDSNAWWLDMDIRKKLAKIYLGKGMLAKFVDTIFQPIQETLFIETTNLKVKPRRKIPKSVLSERVKLLDDKPNDIIFRGFRPVASSTDIARTSKLTRFTPFMARTKASRARKKLQKLAAEKEEKKAAALATGMNWQSDLESDEEPQQALRKPPLPSLLKDDEHYQLLLDLCKALASLHRYWEELEIINYSLKVGEHILPPDRKEELRLLGVQVAYKTTDPTRGYDYAKYLVQKQPYSMSAWNCYYKVVSRMENRFSKHAKFLLRMRGQYKDCVPPMIICGHQFSMISQHQSAAKEYLEAYKVLPDNPLINLCVGTTLINLALGFRVQNKNQCVAQGFAFLYNCQRLCENNQEPLYNIARACQHVGFVTLAAAYYEKVLAMNTKDYPIPKLPNEESSEIKNAGYCSLHREAAYNLHLVYKASGAFDLARQVLKDYCSP